MKHIPIAALIALAALPSMAIAQTARACVTEAEARHVITIALPDTISALANRCRAALPVESFLIKSGSAFAERFRPTAETSWPRGKPILFKIAGPQAKMFEALPDTALRPMFTALVSTVMSDRVEPDQCGIADRTLATLAPLPVENIAELALLLAVAESKRPLAPGKQRPFSLCAAPSAKPVPVNRPASTTTTK